MHRDEVKPFAIRDSAVALSIALNYAVRLKLIPANPAAAVGKPKTPKRDMLFLTDDQAKVVRSAAVGAVVGPLVVTALGSGCRQGELLALTWDDVDLKTGTLTVRRSLSKTRTGFVVKAPKTEASRRAVKLPAFAVESLTAHKAAAMQSELLRAPVFCTRTGGYLDKKNVLRAFRSLVKRSNKAIAAAATPGEHGPKPIPAKIRFHDLRHTVASLLLSKGHSLRAVSQRLGHANPTMTLRVYAHCMPTDDAQLAESLDRMIG
jgi:integrase